MKREFVDYAEALALKEVGFDEPCFGYYHICDTQELKDIFECDYFFHEKAGNFNSNCSLLKTPLYQQAFRWFREEHVLEGISQRAEDKVWYKFSIYLYLEDGKRLRYGGYEYLTSEEAELACLKKLIEIVKK